MFVIFKLWYICQYNIHFKLSSIYELLISRRIHTYITHIYKRSRKTGKYAAKYMNKLSGTKKNPWKCPYFSLCQTFDPQIWGKPWTFHVTIYLGKPVDTTWQSYLFHSPIETIHFIILTSSTNGVWRAYAPLMPGVFNINTDTNTWLEMTQRTRLCKY